MSRSRKPNTLPRNSMAVTPTCSATGYMDTTTLLIIIIIVLLVGGGWYGRTLVLGF